MQMRGRNLNRRTRHANGHIVFSHQYLCKLQSCAFFLHRINIGNVIAMLRWTYMELISFIVKISGGQTSVDALHFSLKIIVKYFYTSSDRRRQLTFSSSFSTLHKLASGSSFGRCSQTKRVIAKSGTFPRWNGESTKDTMFHPAPPSLSYLFVLCCSETQPPRIVCHPPGRMKVPHLSVINCWLSPPAGFLSNGALPCGEKDKVVLFLSVSQGAKGEQGEIGLPGQRGLPGLPGAAVGNIISLAWHALFITSRGYCQCLDCVLLFCCPQGSSGPMGPRGPVGERVNKST